MLGKSLAAVFGGITGCYLTILAGGKTKDKPDLYYSAFGVIAAVGHLLASGFLVSSQKSTKDPWILFVLNSAVFASLAIGAAVIMALN